MDNGDGLKVVFSCDQVIFRSVTDFYDSIPVDLLNYSNPIVYQNAQWIGRRFEHAWQPIEAMREPDMRALKNWFVPMRDALIARIPPPRRKRRQAVWSDDGNEVSYDRLRSGQECFRSLRTVQAEGSQEVALLVDMVIDKKVVGAELYWRGAAVSALADRLEAAGYIVEVWAISRVSPQKELKPPGTEPCAMIAVQLKAGGQNLEVASMVNVLSWMPRVVIYPLLYTSPCMQRSMRENESPTTRSWYWFDLWTLDPLNLPVKSYLLYGFHNLEASIESMLAVLSDLEVKKG
jgi:hypothetical protein